MRLAALVALVALFAPDRALACSIVCGPRLLPRAPSDAAPARVPVGAVFVQLVTTSPVCPPVTSGTLSITRVRGTHTDSFTMAIGTEPLALPDARLDDRFTVTIDGFESTTLHVMPAAPPPSTFGAFDVGSSRVAPVAVRDDGGSCTSDLTSAVADYTYTLDPSWNAWADTIVLTAMLDGSPWPEPVGVGEQRVHAHCVPPTSLQRPNDTTPGEHRLRIDAAIRGSSTVISSEEITFELTCNGGASGCAVSPPRHTSARAPLGLALALALVLARRRR